MTAKVNKKNCTGCRSCVDVCPTEAIEMDGDIARIEQEECICCETCIDECSAGALSMSN